MKIEAGCYYRTSDGRKEGPMSQYGHKECDMWRGILDASVWTGRGSPLIGKTDYLVAEWTEEPAALKKWGEMTDAEKGALLLAHHEGKQIQATAQWLHEWEDVKTPGWHSVQCYRVRPPDPVRETFTRHIRRFGEGWLMSTERIGSDTHRITFPVVNCEVPTGTYTNEDGERIVVERVND